ncbi:prephenate dehydrogenase [Paenalcaligenes hominis]|uniref:Prephenate dehydrogenase n=1 Tax=Paenalcaligenes hominis TaxID=643674 RepID=A0A1U9JZ36_9BURK|nr:prephenate dehydrogenase/arogenate dehydrogenase family protein [Paenalcaligenes hominis]AQS51026.1 prephenate dehydrogenase [Paenalcaligenes hominis]NJB63954.1 prephenate dehydrogenase [Paenalcaligenes hominis]GGE61901.1 prephenate dehydrogenase [Paenalcaligenes hominis]
MATPTAFTIPVLAVVGPGLIGGSLAAALKQAGCVGRVLGVSRQVSTTHHALQLGLIDEIVDITTAAQRADIIVLATPVGATRSLLQQIKPHLQPHTLITDAGSTKADVLRAATEVLGGQIGQFIPGHPIAGAEKAGPEAALADLYRNRIVILTPHKETAPSAKAKIIQLWEQCGARVMLMSAEEHDRVLASISHVPHFLSSVFMWQVASAADADVRLHVAGSGFRDFTRIAAGSAEVWRDIFLSNRAAVLSELKQVRAAFEQAETALLESDGTALYEFLEKAALARRLWGSRSGLE